MLYLSKVGYLIKMARKCGGLLVTCREVGLLVICTQFGSKHNSLNSKLIEVWFKVYKEKTYEKQMKNYEHFMKIRKN